MGSSQNDQIIVVAQMTSQADKLDELRAELRALLAPTRAEKPCIQYDMHESADTPGTFLFYEIWESHADLEAHLATPHLQRFFSLAPNLLQGDPDITIWKRVEC